MQHKTVLGLEEARSIVLAVLKAASEIKPGPPMSVAVVDDGGLLIYFARMDGAHPLTVRMAINKAYTAIQWKKNTREIQAYLKERGLDISCYGDPDRQAPVAGGILIKLKDGSIAGAVGASGRTVEEDDELVSIGASAIKA